MTLLAQSGPSARSPRQSVAAAHPPPARSARLLSAPPDSSLAAHVGHWGDVVHPPDLIAEVRRAGLRGCGGGSFPTAEKLAAVRTGAGRRRRAVVVANGTESEPASAKDVVLLERNPHLVIDGMLVAARAVGADRAYLCVKGAAPGIASRLEAALHERRADERRVELELVRVPSRYVAGHERALVNWLTHDDPRPDGGPPPARQGVDRRPTLVDNVETLANLALIARFGAPWWRGVGTVDDPGTRLLTVGGAVRHPGVFEVPQGTPLAHVLVQAGAEEAPAGVLVGGYFGTWLSPDQATSLTLGRDSLAGAGASLGCGVVAVLPGDRCPLAEVAGVARWLAGQSAGQCGPCANGLPAIAGALEALAEGNRPAEAERLVRRWAAMVPGRGACALPDGAVGFVVSGLRAFAAHVAQHRSGAVCPDAGPTHGRVLPVPASVVGR